MNFKCLIVWFFQGLILLWLLWWGIFADLLPFNQYEDSEFFAMNCRSDGGFVALLSIWIIWITTAIVLAISIRVKFWHRVKALYFINTVAISLSSVSFFRYLELLDYTKELKEYCEFGYLSLLSR